tara:strand:+ start:6284 stop:6622 length:339 start_codon:yes stop_codon:yes gene_type:complete
MKKRKITVSIDTTYKYVQLWNGIFNLTDKELAIISAFIDVNIVTKDINICSVPNKKSVAEIVGIKDYNTLNNYVKKFKDKGALILRQGAYKLNPFLNPNTDMVEIKINRGDL